MPDNFTTLSNRLLSRCPAVGIALAEQFINDSWHELQARREWSWRRGSYTIAPPVLYNTGTCSTNVGSGNPYLITGVGTAWDSSMVGRQIRVNGLLYRYYTITAVLSPTALLLDQPWAGQAQSNVPYVILKTFYEMPSDFGYFYTAVSQQGAFRLFTNVSQNDLAILDPQRTNYGQSYALSFLDYTPIYGGVVGPVVPVAASGPSPVSTTSYGYNYPADATFIVQVVTGGVVGVATYQWMRSGQTSFTGPVVTSNDAQDLMSGVMLYWPNATYVQNDLFIINCVSMQTDSGPRYELWPAPVYNFGLFPTIYIKKEYDINTQMPTLPPFIANRGEVLLELSLHKAATFPGTKDNPNPYYDLKLAEGHMRRYEYMLVDLERNDEEIGVSNVSYQNYPFYPAPWLDASWQQRHAPFIGGL